MKRVILLSIFSLFFISCLNYVPQQNETKAILSQPLEQQLEPEETETIDTEQPITTEPTEQQTVSEPEETQKSIIIQNESTTLIARRFSIKYKTPTDEGKTKTLRIQDVGPGTTMEIESDFSIPEGCTIEYITIEMNVVNYPENGWFAKKLDLDLLLDKTKRKNIKIIGDRKDIKIEMAETE